jgi:hypothetical protein
MRLPALFTLAVALAACPTKPDVVPLDGPVFPTGMALHPDGTRLVVVSSDYDLRFEEGALLVADLGVVRAGLAADGAGAIVEDAYMPGAGVRVPAIADKPVFTADGSRLYVPSRRTNVVMSLDFNPDTGLSCGPSACGEPPRVLQLPANDPFTILLTAGPNRNGRVDGLVTLESSQFVFFFRDDPAREGAARMQITSTLDLGDAVGGVRSAVLRPPRGGSDAHVIAGIELSRARNFLGASIAAFVPSADARLHPTDVTALTGSLALRDMLLVPGDDGPDDALVVALRAPDALARFEIDDDAGFPRLRLSALSPTCRTPLALALATVGTPAGGASRVLVTCPAGNTVVSVDPVSLQTKDAVRFFGRTPYDVVVNGEEAFVTFFDDNSVGVFSLVDAEGFPALEVRGRIGTPAPRPEDGRE